MAVDWLSEFGHLIMDTFTADFCISPLLWKVFIRGYHWAHSCEKTRLICFIIYLC